MVATAIADHLFQAFTVVFGSSSAEEAAQIALHRHLCLPGIPLHRHLCLPGIHLHRHLCLPGISLNPFNLEKGGAPELISLLYVLVLCDTVRYNVT